MPPIRHSFKQTYAPGCRPLCLVKYRQRLALQVETFMLIKRPDYQLRQSFKRKRNGPSSGVEFSGKLAVGKGRQVRPPCRGRLLGCRGGGCRRLLPGGPLLGTAPTPALHGQTVMAFLAFGGVAIIVGAVVRECLDRLVLAADAAVFLHLSGLWIGAAGELRLTATAGRPFRHGGVGAGSAAGAFSALASKQGFSASAAAGLFDFAQNTSPLRIMR